MKPRKLLPQLTIIFCLILAACNVPSLTQSESGDEPDLSEVTEPAYEDDLSQFADLGFEWVEEMPDGGVTFTGTMGNCSTPEEWDVFLALTETLEPGKFLLITGETTVDIHQVGADMLGGDFEVWMYGTMTHPDCTITYDLMMELSVEITPSSLEIIQAEVGSQDVQVSCSDPGADFDPPPLIFPTDLVVAPMSGTFECFEP